MANFQAAFDRTLKHEGGYSNIPEDKGKETYRGISRRWYPEWDGWDIIDDYKTVHSLPTLNSALARNKSLAAKVRDFYKSEYWDPLHCEGMESQMVVNELYDTAVLMSKHRAVKILQRGLNALNKNEAFYADITVDGRMGAKTLQTLQDCLVHNDETLLVKIQDGLQLARFIDNMDKDPEQEHFARGWITHRINIGKV